MAGTRLRSGHKRGGRGGQNKTGMETDKVNLVKKTCSVVLLCSTFDHEFQGREWLAGWLVGGGMVAWAAMPACHPAPRVAC